MTRSPARHAPVLPIPLPGLFATVFALATLGGSAIGQIAAASPAKPSTRDSEFHHYTPIRFVVHDLGSLYPDEQPGDDVGVNATAINEHGDIAGISMDAPWPFGAPRPFRYDYALDEMVPIGADQDVEGSAKGLNDHGVVVGYWYQPIEGGEEARPFIAGPDIPIHDPLQGNPGFGDSWGVNNAGQAVAGVRNDMYLIEPDGTVRPFAYGVGAEFPWEINNHGMVTGQGRVPDGRIHCFAYDSATDTMTSLHQPRWSQSLGYGLNDRGDIVGFAEYPDFWRPATIWTAEGDIIEFGLQRWGIAYAYDQAEHVNMLGDVVGLSTAGRHAEPVGWISFGAARARFAGQYTDPGRPTQYRLWDLATPESQSEWQTWLHPFEINDARQIVGIGVDIHGRSRAFLADPVPVLEGDFDLDGSQSWGDFLVVLEHFGKRGARPLEGDTNLDRVVDISDILNLIALMRADQNEPLTR